MCIVYTRIMRDKYNYMGVKLKASIFYNNNVRNLDVLTIEIVKTQEACLNDI